MSKNKPSRNPIVSPTPSNEPPIVCERPERIVVELVRIDLAILEDCIVSDSVTVRWQEEPIPVTLPSGIYLGEVSADDAPLVKGRRSSVGEIVIRDVEKERCAIEV